MRVIGRLLVALTVAFPLVVVLAGVAGGSTGPGNLALECDTFKDEMNISPGLGNTPANQTVIGHGKIFGCNKFTEGARFGATLQMTQATCANIEMRGPASLDWLDGAHSSMSLVFHSHALEPNKLQVTGFVTSGRFQGLSVRSWLRFERIFTGTGAPCSPTNLLRNLEFINSRSFQLITVATTTTTQPPATLPSTTQPHPTTPTAPTTVPVTNFGGPTTAPPPVTVINQGPPNNGGGVTQFPQGTLAFTGSSSALAATFGFEALLIGGALACADPERRRRRFARFAYTRRPKSFLQVTLPPMH
jgi:hypothetical protein